MHTDVFVSSNQKFLNLITRLLDEGKHQAIRGLLAWFSHERLESLREENPWLIEAAERV